MRTLIYLVLIVFFFISFIFSQNIPQTQTIDLTQDEFKNRLTSAFEAEETNTAKTLIRKNQYKVHDILNDVLNSYLENSFTENDLAKNQEILKAKQIAQIYFDLFQKDYFLKKVTLYENWTLEQKQNKSKADSLSEESEKAYNNYKMQLALEKIHLALEIYEQIADREAKAVCLNRIGQIHLRLTNFPMAEKYLEKSLDINRELKIWQGVTTNLQNLSDVYKALHKYQQALDIIQEAIKISEKIGNNKSQAEQWKCLGAIYHSMSDYDKAFENYNKALKYSEQTQDNDLKAAVLLHLGSAFNDKSDFQKSIYYWEDGLVLARKIENQQLEGSFLSNLGNAYRNLGQYDKSLLNLKQALYLNRLTVNSWREGNTLREMGIVFYYKGLPDSSLRCWQESIKVFKNIQDWSMVGMVTGHIGIYYKNAGKPFEALKSYEEALKLVREINNEREEANILGNIGNVYTDILADYPMAEYYYKKSLKIKEQVGETAFIGKISGILGVLRENQGDYQTSLNYYHKALKIARQCGDKSNQAKMNGNIGVVYANLGEYNKALQYLEKRLEIVEEIGEKHKKAEILNNLGIVYWKLGKELVALEYFKKSKELAIEVKQPEFIIDVDLKLGGIYEEKKEFNAALQTYESALHKAKKISALRKQGEILTSLGSLNRRMLKYKQALENYKDGLNIAQKIHAPEDIWKAQLGLGAIFENQGKNEKALEHYKNAINTIESIRSGITIASLKQSFMEEKIEAYQSIIQLLLKLGRVKEAFKYMERAKAKSLLDILSTDRINLTEGISPERLMKKKKVEWKLRRINELFRSELSKMEVEQNSQYIKTLMDSLKNIHFEHEEVLKEIQLNHPRYAQLTGMTESLSLKDIQSKIITDDKILVSYLVCKENTLVWIASRNNLWCERLNISDKQLTAMVDSLLYPCREIKLTGKAYNIADIKFDLKISRRLYKTIFQPIEKYLSQNTSIIIIPDGRLYYLPFEMLVTHIEKKPFLREILFSRYENAHYLVEKYPISYSYSASVLDPRIIKKGDRKIIKGELLAIGNPDFGIAEDTKPISNPIASVREIRNARLIPLPGSQKEIEFVSRLFKPTVMLNGKSATELACKQQSPSFKMLHLATHGFANEKQPMYSWLALALDSMSGEDGYLHAYEILNLDLNADLVTLSACETGLGKLSKGEGLIGLIRAFMYAGASSLLVSLWNVEESAAEIMTSFYQNLKNKMTKSEALRQAKVKLIRSRGKFSDGIKFSYAHPFLWAPFVLLGESK